MGKYPVSYLNTSTLQHLQVLSAPLHSVLSLVDTPALSPAAAAAAAVAVEAVAAVMLVELGSAVSVLHHWLPTNKKQDIYLFGFLGIYW